MNSVIKKTIFSVLIFIMTISAIEGLLQLGSYIRVGTQNYSQKNFEDKKVILCLGESTTAVGLAASYPSLLQKKLDQLYGPQFKVINAGVPGTSLSEIYNDLDRLLNKFNPDIIITMIGINDLLNTTQKGFIRSPFKLVQIYHWLSYRFSDKNKTYELSPDEKSYILMRRTSDVDHFENEAFDLIEQKNFISALTAYKNLALHHPTDKSVLWYIGLLNLHLGYYSEAINSFNDYLKVYNKTDDEILVCWLIRMYFNKDSTELFNFSVQLLERNPNKSKNVRILFLLARFYRDVENYDKSMDLYLQADQISPCFEGVIYGVRFILQRQGRDSEIEKWNKKCPDTVRNVYFNDVVSSFHLNTEQSSLYKKIIQKSVSKTPDVVVMQYPTAPIEPLRRILSEYENLLFVDNEKNFKEELKTKQFRELFFDNFAGSFGHATAYGNEILVNNLADVLKETNTFRDLQHRDTSK